MIKKILLYILSPFLVGILVIFFVNTFAFLSGVPRGVDFSIITFLASLIATVLAALASFIAFLEFGLGGEKK